MLEDRSRFFRNLFESRKPESGSYVDKNDQTSQLIALDGVTAKEFHTFMTYVFDPLCVVSFPVLGMTLGTEQMF